MSYAVGEHFERFIKNQVQAGRYNNASEVVREGLRLVEEREAKLQALKKHIDAAIAKGGHNTDEDVMAYVEAHLDKKGKQQECV
jgi:antitoxin ParD1/3/4